MLKDRSKPKTHKIKRQSLPETLAESLRAVVFVHDVDCFDRARRSARRAVSARTPGD